MQKRKHRVILKDVAREANVNFTLVSKFLTGNPQARMRDETKQRIQRAVEKLGYRPSIAARTLRNGKSKTIGLLIGDLTNAYYAHVANLILRQLSKRGYQLLIALSDSSKNDSCYDAIQSLISREVDGIISIGDNMISPSSIPVPVVVNDTRLKDACEVNLDLASSLSSALLHADGKIQGLFITHSLWATEFKKAAKSLGKDVEAINLPYVANERNAILKSVIQDRPDVIFTSGWQTALALFDLLKQTRGYLPKIFLHANCKGEFLRDKHVAGYIYSSTTELVKTSCDILISKINADEKFSRISKIPTSFISADSAEFSNIAKGEFSLT